MKVYFISLFMVLCLNLQAQKIPNRADYNSEIVDYIRNEIFVCFPLNVKKSDGKIFKVLTSNYDLYNYYYNKMAFHPEFADTIGNLLKCEFIELSSYPKLIESAINTYLYKKLTNQGISKTIKKYFDIVTFKDNSVRVKKKYLSKQVMLTVLCFMSENNYIITSDNDGYYVAALLN